MTTLNTAQILDALAARHSKAWAFMPQVREATGFGGFRICDALAMSLWPSRGLELHGFEIKSNRIDWLRELNKPEKAEAICAFCDRWWVVAGDLKIVRDDELPPTWGLMVPRGAGLVVKVQAPKLEAKPITRDFLASILRRAAEDLPFRDRQTSDYARGVEQGKQSRTVDHNMTQHGLDRFRESLADFEEASGVKINDWDGKRIGAAVATVMKLTSMKRLAKDMERASFILTGAASEAEIAVESMRVVMSE
ncbi:MAG: hypothetical protein IID41_12530 [Planctomycetes bacterium]|nr:hypothetical protein [Planctomycetota bacterium]